MLLILVASITSALVIERVIFAWISLIFYILNQGPDRKSTLFVSSIVQNCTSFAGSTLSALFSLFSLSIRTLFWWAIAIFIFGILFTLARFSGDALTSFQNKYNLEVGGALRFAVVVPLQLLKLMWSGCVPLYNLVVYCARTIPIRILIENFLRNFSQLESAMLNLGYFVETLVVSLFNYIQVIMYPPDSFDPNLRLLDLITPLGYWRLTVSYILSWFGNMCSVASSLLDIILYPFLDINFGLGVHNAINSVLTLMVQVPAVTIQRCSAGQAMVYCIPDFEPVIELAVIGIRNFGSLVDNWLDITSIIIQSVLTNTSPACTGWEAVDFTSGGSIMGNNETIIVGIDNDHFAKTDGWNAVVYSRAASQSFPAIFPFAVNIEFGIAVVSVSSGVKGLLGCTCTDVSYGMQLLCGVAPLDTLSDSYIVPVEFDVPTTSFYMGCGKSKIRLDSIRWPVTRYTSPNSNSRQSPIAEAALYVRPACGSEHIDMVCIDTFKLSGCFPYCMALWTNGYSGSLVLRGGEEWANTVQMVSRDCGLHSWDLKSGDVESLTKTLRQNSGVKSTWMDAEVQLNSSHCVYAPNTFSRMLRNVTNSYTGYRSVLLSGQPFAFAGDLVLTAVNTVGDTWGIDVQRIWGNQVHTLSIRILATCLRVSVRAERLGRAMRSWIALGKLISFLGFFRPVCCNSNSAAVSGRTTARANVCDARFRLLPFSVANRSSAYTNPSSVTRTCMPGTISSNATCIVVVFDRIKYRITSSRWFTSTSSSPPFLHAPRLPTAKRRRTRVAPGSARWRCLTRLTARHGPTSPRWQPIGTSSGSQTPPWPCTGPSASGAIKRWARWRSRPRAPTAASRYGAWIHTSFARRTLRPA